jgi:2',3'-cyclic-nucleotide 2'-phosphodiesterase (5'-nucleotidase family)
MGSLPLLAGYVANLRAARKADGGGVLLLDGGDMFQGTLESNLGEGIGVVEGYAALGYDAVAIGNHEFDFGPVGPKSTPHAPGDDPRGALKALTAAAPFPFLGANLRERGGATTPAWPHVRPSTVVEVAGLRVGVVGLLTEETLHTTISANVTELAIEPLAETLAAEAKRLREAERADVVVAVMHAGGKCAAFTGDTLADKCELESEAFRLARALPLKTVDAIFGGHSHAGVAHAVADIPIAEAFAYGTHFSRVDLVVEGSPPHVASHRIHLPQELCPGKPRDPDWEKCDAGSYEGRRVERDARVSAAIAPHLAKAAAKKADALGVTLEATIERRYDTESALGNLLADLLREARPGVSVAMMNGGGLRADLPAGKVTYGSLFESFPFDNRIATAKLPARDVAAILATNLQRSGGIISVSGVSVVAKCKGPKLEVELFRGKQRVPPDETLTLLASDFMMTGGDAFWGDLKPPATSTEDTFMRDVFEAALRKRKTLAPAEVYDAKKPRMASPPRPVKCAP